MEALGSAVSCAVVRPSGDVCGEGARADPDVGHLEGAELADARRVGGHRLDPVAVGAHRRGEAVAVSAACREVADRRFAGRCLGDRQGLLDLVGRVVVLGGGRVDVDGAPARAREAHAARAIDRTVGRVAGRVDVVHQQETRVVVVGGGVDVVAAGLVKGRRAGRGHGDVLRQLCRRRRRGEKNAAERAGEQKQRHEDPLRAAMPNRGDTQSGCQFSRRFHVLRAFQGFTHPTLPVTRDNR